MLKEEFLKDPTFHTPEFYDSCSETEILNNLSFQMSPSRNKNNTESRIYTKQDLIKIFTDDHIERYLLSLLFMGIVQIKRLENYFKKNNLFFPEFLNKVWYRVSSGKLSCGTLSGKALFNFIHAHIRFPLDEMQRFFFRRNKELWNPTTKVTIDEIMIRKLAKFPFWVKIPMKPDLAGAKIFGLVDENIFLYKFWMYPRSMPPNHVIVHDFASSLPSSNHIICGDRWFGGLKTAKKVQETGNKSLFVCKSDRPSWLFGNGMEKELRSSPNKNFLQKSDGEFLVSTFKQTSSEKKFVNVIGDICGFDDDDDFLKLIPDASLFFYNIQYYYVDEFDKQWKSNYHPHRNMEWTAVIGKAMIEFMFENIRRYFISVYQEHYAGSTFKEMLAQSWYKELTGTKPTKRLYQKFLHRPNDPEKSRLKNCHKCSRRNQDLRCVMCDKTFCRNCFLNYHLYERCEDKNKLIKQRVLRKQKNIPFYIFTQSTQRIILRNNVYLEFSIKGEKTSKIAFPNILKKKN